MSVREDFTTENPPYSNQTASFFRVPSSKITSQGMVSLEVSRSKNLEVACGVVGWGVAWWWLESSFSPGVSTPKIRE